MASNCFRVADVVPDAFVYHYLTEAFVFVTRLSFGWFEPYKALVIVCYVSV